MKRAIPSLYAEYGRYVDEFRAIPYYIDCLKPVERRILYTLFNVAKKLTKSARVIGEALGKYHPHGDQSAYGTLIGLVRRGFAVGQGNWGASGFEETEAAAFRYTEVSCNKNISDLAFEFIKYVKHHDPENLSYEQPVYLPCPIPIGLVGDSFIQGISFHTTKIPRYTLIDLINRLMYLLKRETDPNTPEVLIKPFFPNCTIYEKTPGAFNDILTTGVGSIHVVPNYVVEAKQIRITTKPALGFSALKANADDPKKPDQRKYTIMDMSQKKTMDVWIQPQSGIIDQPFVNMIHKFISDDINFLCNVVDDNGIVKTTPIDNLLINSYKNWVLTYQLKLTNDKNIVLETLYELTVISVIREILQDNSTNITKTEDVVNLYTNNVKYQKPNINGDIIRQIVNKHKIKTLLEYTINNTTLQQELITIETQLLNMTQTAYLKLSNLFS